MLNFSFSAGMTAFFNPCGFAMLPAYVSYYLGQGEGSTRNLRHGILRGVQLGATLRCSALCRPALDVAL